MISDLTAAEWHDISLCVGWTLAMADSSPEGKGREVVAQRAMETLKNKFGDGFHARFVQEKDHPASDKGVGA